MKQTNKQVYSFIATDWTKEFITATQQHTQNVNKTFTEIESTQYSTFAFVLEFLTCIR